MRVLTAGEAISPALQRTREVLFGPRRFGTFFKISCVATLAAMGDGLNMHFNSWSNHGSGMSHATPQMTAVIAAIAAFAVLIALIFFAVFLVIFYIGNRMQFVLFDMVLTRRSEVRPAWRLYASRTWRWIGTKIALFLSFFVVAVIAAMPLILKFIHASHAGIHPSMSTWLGWILGSALVIFLFAIILFVVSALLHDFVLPAVALEDARVIPTLGRLGALCAAEPGQIALYLVLRFVFAILLMIATIIAIIIASIAAGIVLGLIGLLLFFLLHHHGIIAMIFMVLAFIVEGVIFLAFLLMVDVAIVGWYMTFQQAWALYFLGGRYTLLGDLLEPPVVYATPAPPMPPPFTPEYPPTEI